MKYNSIINDSNKCVVYYDLWEHKNCIYLIVKEIFTVNINENIICTRLCTGINECNFWTEFVLNRMMNSNRREIELYFHKNLWKLLCSHIGSMFQCIYFKYVTSNVWTDEVWWESSFNFSSEKIVCYIGSALYHILLLIKSCNVR